LNIDTSSEQIGADEVATHTIAEVVENSISVLLEHSSVRVEARVAQLCNLLRKKFNSVGGVAENDRLVYLKL
jgi:hypothetical protein